MGRYLEGLVSRSGARGSGGLVPFLRTGSPLAELDQRPDAQPLVSSGPAADAAPPSPAPVGRFAGVRVSAGPRPEPAAASVRPSTGREGAHAASSPDASPDRGPELHPPAGPLGPGLSRAGVPPATVRAARAATSADPPANANRRGRGQTDPAPGSTDGPARPARLAPTFAVPDDTGSDSFRSEPGAVAATPQRPFGALLEPARGSTPGAFVETPGPSISDVAAPPQRERTILEIGSIEVEVVPPTTPIATGSAPPRGPVTAESVSVIGPLCGRAGGRSRLGDGRR